MIVFMTPPLKNIPSVPFVSKFPAVSVPLLIVYVFLIYYLAKKYLAGTDDKRSEAWKYGISLVLISIILDTLVIVVAFKGHDYFSYLSMGRVCAALVCTAEGVACGLGAGAVARPFSEGVYSQVSDDGIASVCLECSL